MSDILGAGRLEDHPFPALAGEIFREGRSGELVIESGGRRRSVWFLGGNPVAVLSEDPQDHLSQILLEHGRISADEAQRLAAIPETREGLGSVDFLQKDTLNWGVKFRFVNLCYDLFRWEDGDYGFREGNPPKELFLLKVPAPSLIFKGVGYLVQSVLFDAVPDEAVIGPGPVAGAEARYLGAEERGLLEACRPGRTVADVVGEAGDGADQARRTIYALSCLGLLSLSRRAAAGAVAAQHPDDYGFVLEEPDAGQPIAAPPEFGGTAAGAKDFTFDAEESRREPEFTLPQLDLPCEPAPGSGLSASDFVGADTLPGTAGMDREFPTEGGDPFAPAAAAPGSPGAGAKAPAGRKSARLGRGLHLPRLAGIALGTLCAAALIGAAGWWWMSSEEAPPPVVRPVKRPAPPPAPSEAPPAPPALATPAPPATTAPVPAAPAPAPAAPAPAPVAAPVAAPIAAPIAAPAPRAAAAPGASPADRYRNALEVFRAGDLDGAATIWESLLAESHRGDFTILLLTACQPETIRDAQRAFASRQIYLVAKDVKGRRCFRVGLDTFDSREAASRSLAGIPAPFRSAGAAVRPVADVLSTGR